MGMAFTCQLWTWKHLPAAKQRLPIAPQRIRFCVAGQWIDPQALSSGVRVSLGSDIGAGYQRSMVRVAAAMIEAAALIGDDFPSAAQAWYWITAGNAAVLGLSGIGSIEVGGGADLVIARPDVAWLADGADPLAMAMWAWDDRWIEEVVLRGQPVLTRG